MRPLKFRTWHPQGGMSNPFTIDDIIEAACCQHYPKYPRQEYVTMQYTGLKDKNGVEIYEGDIADHHNLRFIVEWTEAFGLWSVYNGETDDLLGNHSNVLEIIGNIYENPELVVK